MSATKKAAPGLDPLKGANGSAPGGLSAPPYREEWKNLTGFYVAAIGLLVLLGIVAIAMLTLPDDRTKGQNIITLATAAFGVIGAVTGAYFGVRAANKAAERMERSTR